MGGSPTTSVNRRASPAREMPAVSASDATVQDRWGWRCIARRADPTTASVWARYLPSELASVAANRVRSAATSSRSSGRSRTAYWPGRSRATSSAGHATRLSEMVAAGWSSSGGSAASKRRLVSLRSW